MTVLRASTTLSMRTFFMASSVFLTLSLSKGATMPIQAH